MREYGRLRGCRQSEWGEGTEGLVVNSERASDRKPVIGVPTGSFSLLSFLRVIWSIHFYLPSLPHPSLTLSLSLSLSNTCPLSPVRQRERARGMERVHSHSVLLTIGISLVRSSSPSICDNNNHDKVTRNTSQNEGRDVISVITDRTVIDSSNRITMNWSNISDPANYRNPSPYRIELVVVSFKGRGRSGLLYWFVSGVVSVTGDILITV